MDSEDTKKSEEDSKNINESSSTADSTINQEDKTSSDLKNPQNSEEKNKTENSDSSSENTNIEKTDSKEKIDSDSSEPEIKEESDEEYFKNKSEIIYKNLIKNDLKKEFAFDIVVKQKQIEKIDYELKIQLLNSESDILNEFLYSKSQRFTFKKLMYDKQYKINFEILHKKGTRTLKENITWDPFTFTIQNNKKELKNIDFAKIMKIEANNLLEVNINDINTIKNFDSYIIKLKSDGFKEIYIPISSIEEKEEYFEIKYQLNDFVTYDLENDYYTTDNKILIFKNSEQQKLKTISFDNLNKYIQSNEIIYKNILKLTPFYNRDQIVNYGNKIDTNNILAKKEIFSIMPMQNNRFISNYQDDSNNINRLMIRFKDNTIEYFDLENISTQKTIKYRIANTELIYEPEIKLLSENINNKIDELNEYIRNITLKQIFIYTFSEKQINEKKSSLGAQATREQAIEELWTEKVWTSGLKIRLEKILENPKIYIKKLIQTSWISFNDNFLITKIKKIKEKAISLILGLAYIEENYKIHAGDNIVITELMLFNHDFWNEKKVNTLENIINIGNRRIDPDLFKRNTFENFDLLISRNVLGKSENEKFMLNNFFDDLKKLFDPQTNTIQEWYVKAAKNVYVVENESRSNNFNNHFVFDKLNKGLNKYLLPLLNFEEELIFVISNMSTIIIGNFEKYVDISTKITNPTNYQSEMARVKREIDKTGDELRNYHDVVYRIVADSVKEKVLTNFPTWDSLRTHLNINNWWSSKYSNDPRKVFKSVRQLLTPLGDWFPSRNSIGAYATGNIIRFVLTAILSNDGRSIYTHEVTHNTDNRLFLLGNGRRHGQSAEHYAKGLLQSPESANAMVFGFNLFTTYPQGSIQNSSPDRFQNTDDIDKYINRLMDVIYLLDYAEAESMLKTNNNDDIKKKLLIKMKMVVTPPQRLSSAADAKDTFVNYTDEEWNNLQWNNVYDLVENDAVSSRNDFRVNGTIYPVSTVGNILNYLWIPLFTPMYAALQNKYGTTGGYTFRRMALEFWAEGGLHNEFVDYTSNKYKGPSEKLNIHLSDDYLITKMFNGQYSSFKDFKKAMFKKRIDKKHLIKAISFTWRNKNYNITSFDQIQELMNQEILNDYNAVLKKRGVDNVRELKKVIYLAFKNITNEFRTSIFNEENTN